ncbi:hypothetical protein LBMAG42_45720 [Deltaproteobacteria bacterium]|nr:hypothetical protein LBMAG42_45720 [Deltaproteobacteria bacterium]
MCLALLAFLACPTTTDTPGDLATESGGDTGEDSAADSGEDTAGDTGTDSGGDTAGDTSDTAEPGPDWVRVDADGGVRERSVDVAVATDGTAFVSWVDGSDVCWARRSTDGGVTWGDPAAVNADGTTASVAMARRPYVVTDGSRVAVAFVDLDSRLVEVYASDAANLDFEHVATLGAASDNNDFAKPVFVDGDLVVEWQTYNAEGAMVLARESTGWGEEPADDTIPGVPCECCPNDVFAASTGELLVAFRNNDDDLREHWVSIFPGGESAEVTDIEGDLATCPMQGPRIAEAPGGLLIVWADASMDGRTWLESSDDFGRTWSNERDILGRTGTGSPTIATGLDGRVFVTTESGRISIFALSDDGGTSFSAPETLASPSGDLGFGQVESGGGVTLVGGSGADGSAWVYRPR